MAHLTFVKNYESKTSFFGTVLEGFTFVFCTILNSIFFSKIVYVIRLEKPEIFTILFVVGKVEGKIG